MDLVENDPDGATPVSLAVRNGNIDALLALIEQGQSYLERDRYGWSPIHEAAQHNQTLCLQYLIKLDGIELNALTLDRKTPLYVASSCNSLEAARILLDAGADVNFAVHYDDVPPPFTVYYTNAWTTALHIAAAEGHAQMVELLVEYGAKTYMQDSFCLSLPFYLATEQGHHTVIKVLLSKTNRSVVGVNLLSSALQIACERHFRFDGITYQSNYCQVVQLLLDYFPQSTPICFWTDPYKLGIALMDVAAGGCLKCVQALVDGGADPYSKERDTLNGQYPMAVHRAIKFGHLEVTRFLLGIMDPMKILQMSHMSDGEIFLLAASSNRQEMKTLLIESGFKPDDSALSITREDDLKPFVYEKYKLITILGLSMKRQWFDKTLNAAKFLLQCGFCSTAREPEVIPPLVALFSSDGEVVFDWMMNDEELKARYQFQLGVVDLLVREGNALRVDRDQYSAVLNSALVDNSELFRHLLHYGYPVDAQEVKEAVAFLSSRRIRLTPSHKECLIDLSKAGFTIEWNEISDQGRVCPLKQLCRMSIHQHLGRVQQSRTPIAELNLPIPKAFVDFLCFDDI